MTTMFEHVLVRAAVVRIEALIDLLESEGRLYDATPVETREAEAIEAFLTGVAAAQDAARV